MIERAQVFERHLGSPFVATTSAGEVTLRLAEVNRHDHQPDAPRQDPFSLVFTGPTEVLLDQGVHELRHDELGELSIFLVPIGRGAGPLPRYEAVFN